MRVAQVPQLLDVVHQAVQVPLRPYFGNAAQREAAHTLGPGCEELAGDLRFSFQLLHSTLALRVAVTLRQDYRPGNMRSSTESRSIK